MGICLREKGGGGRTRKGALQRRVPGQEAGRVELGRQRHHAGEGHEAVGRSVAEEALHLAGAADTAARVGAQGQIEPWVGALAGAGARRGRRGILVAVAARVEGGMVVDPVGRRCFPVCELAGFHLADDDGAGVDEPLHGDRVGGRGIEEPVPGSVAVARLDAGDVVDVFDAEADAGEGLEGGSGVVEAGGDADGGRLDAGYVGGEGGVGGVRGGD